MANPVGQECTPGYFCPQGSATPTPCPTGTFSNATGNIAESDCQNCTAGTLLDLGHSNMTLMFFPLSIWEAVLCENKC